MSNKKKRKFLIFTFCLMFIVSVFIFTACSGSQAEISVNKYDIGGVEVEITETKLVNDGDISAEEKVVKEQEGFIYAEYDDFQSAFDKADYVVYGEVKEIKEGLMQERRDENFEQDDRSIVFYYTPVVLDIITCYKGDVTAETVTYYALGAEDSENLYVYDVFDTFGINVGDKMLVYLSEQFGFYGSISPNTIFLENENGNIMIDNELLTGVSGNNYSVSEIKMGELNNLISAEAQIYKEKHITE